MLNSRRILLKRVGGAASVIGLTSHVFSKPTAADAPTGPLELVQTLTTSGARTAAPYWIGGNLYLAVPQLAEDIQGGPVGMNFGDSDTDLILYRYQDGRFAEHRGDMLGDHGLFAKRCLLQRSASATTPAASRWR